MQFIALALLTSIALQQPTPSLLPTPCASTRSDGLVGAGADVAAALARASAENRRVLLLWGATWSRACTTLDDRCRRNLGANYELMYEYVVVRVDVGTRKLDKNADLAKSFGAEFEADSLPHLTVLDDTGKVLADLPARSFRDASSRAYDIPRLVEFLRSHHAPRRNAEELLAASMEQAKATDRSVLLTFGAPWGFDGDRFDRWLAIPYVRSQLEKDFVIRKIDVDRTIGGRELWASLWPKDDLVPRFCTVDPNGMLLVNFVKAPDQNTGVPRKDEDVALITALLARLSGRLTAAEVEYLGKTIVPDWERGYRGGRK